MSLLEKIGYGAVTIILIALTFFITKWVYDKDPYLPVITQDMTDVQVSNIQFKGNLGTLELPRPIIVIKEEEKSKPVPDSTKKDTVYVIQVAKVDTNIVLPGQDFVFKDTTFHAPPDTVNIKGQYLFPPVNKFQFDLRYKRDFFVYRKIEKVYVPKPETFLDRFHIGVGYSMIPFVDAEDRIKLKHGISVGFYYSIF